MKNAVKIVRGVIEGLLIIAVAVCANGQQIQGVAIKKAEQATGAKPVSTIGGASEEAIGRKVLEEVGEEAKAASPAVRAKVWMEIAGQMHQDARRNEEGAVLRAAYLATLEDPAPYQSNISWLQSEILRTMVADIGPVAVEELLPRLDEAMRGFAFDLLLTRYANDGNWDAARRTIAAAPKDDWFQFFPATTLASKLPPQRVEDRLAIFQAMYGVCEMRISSCWWLKPLIVSYWREIPREQVLTSIPLILRGAMFADSHVMLKRPMPGYRGVKAELLSIWKELDAAGAEAWERNETQTWDEERKKDWQGRNPELAKLKAGMASRAPAAATLASNEVPMVTPKPRAVIGCLENEPWCQSNRVEHLLAALTNHLLTDETWLAKADATKGFGYALRQWKLDTDAKQPNLLIKTNWPSTVNWEVFSMMASRLSPEYALQRVKEIPDAEIRLLVRTVLARMWLDHRPTFPCSAVHTKYRNEGNCIGYGMYMPQKLFDLGE